MGGGPTGRQRITDLPLPPAHQPARRRLELSQAAQPTICRSPPQLFATRTPPVTPTPLPARRAPPARVDGLAGAPRLRQLDLSGNRLAAAEDLDGLAAVTGSLEVLDVGGNRLEGPSALGALLGLRGLALLRAEGNPVAAATP